MTRSRRCRWSRNCKAYSNRPSVAGEIEMYPGVHHGFAFPQRWCYDKPAAERHWERLLALYRRMPNAPPNSEPACGSLAATAICRLAGGHDMASPSSLTSLFVQTILYVQSPLLRRSGGCLDAASHLPAPLP